MAQQIENEDLRAMVEKLHKFAKWQQTKLAEREGFESECFKDQLQSMMNRSVKVILHRHNLLNAREAAEVAAAQKDIQNIDPGKRHTHLHMLNELAKSEINLDKSPTKLEDEE